MNILGKKKKTHLFSLKQWPFKNPKRSFQQLVVKPSRKGLNILPYWLSGLGVGRENDYIWALGCFGNFRNALKLDCSYTCTTL